VLRPLLLTAALLAVLLAVPAIAGADCNGLPVTVGGATSGDDTLNGTSGNDVIEGLGGNDTINGAGGNDTICGDDGDDVVDGGGGSDHLEGGTAGQTNGDTVTFVSVTVQLTADLQTQTATNTSGDTDAILEFENLTGTNTFDILRGDSGPNVITGLNAADGFQGRGGDDTLVDPAFPVDKGAADYSDATGPVTGIVGAGTHTVSGAGVGTDTLTNVHSFYGSDFADQAAGDATDNDLYGFGGNDLLEPLGGTDNVGGGGGTDTVTYADETGPISADLSTTAFGNVTAPGGSDSVFEVENLVGSAQNDDITGGGESNVFDGLGGDDDLDGGGGADTASFAGLAQGVDANLATGAATGQGTDTLTGIENLTGSSQDDALSGDGGGNAFNGGPAGVDTVRFSTLSQPVTASLATNTATGQGSDTFTGIENLTGSSQDDTLTGDAGPNSLSGMDGADTITGGLGADGFFLGAGLDVIAADDGVVDTIDCEGGGPDSGSVDGPAPAEIYISECNSDGDAAIDFLDKCPAAAGTGTDGCEPPVITPPLQAPTNQATPIAQKKKCKTKKHKRSAESAKKKKCKKKKKKR
jgi:Ca2+-binding RTX toxin-like protein